MHPTIQKWFSYKQYNPQDFQRESWEAYLNEKSGLLNASTGSGKTMAIWLACLAESLQHPNTQKGLQCIWVTPLRALAKDLQIAMQEAADITQTNWIVSLRTGDTTTQEKQKQKNAMPQCIITTPESLHILLAQKDNAKLFKNLKTIVVDEWHELLGTKRGVQTELAIAYLTHTNQAIKIWGISATIGNLQQAGEVLLKSISQNINHTQNISFIKFESQKKLNLIPIIPTITETFSYAGQLGTNLILPLIEVIEKFATTLIFVNVRSQTEVWYQKILAAAPHLAGLIAMHHSSLDKDLRTWVENALHEGKLKSVVCTSSLDLGVDFPTVDCVVQIGSPRSINRFLQRAGRSGHNPNANSTIYFLPTQSLELIEVMALRQAIDKQSLESRVPLQNCFDVLVQFVVTLAVGEGFVENEIFAMLRKTYCFQNLDKETWQWILQFITTGGNSLQQYNEFQKVVCIEGVYQVLQRKIATKHRLSIGTIVSEPLIKVQYQGGNYIGMVEESFAASLAEKDVFLFAGNVLEVVMLKDLILFVKKSKRKTAPTPRWFGSRLSLSGELAQEIQKVLNDIEATDSQKLLTHHADKNIFQAILPLLNRQKAESIIPQKTHFLVEKITTQEGHHLFFYVFEGRTIHEILATLFAYRIAKQQPITFSMAFNEYGFELLSDQEIIFNTKLFTTLLSSDNLQADIANGLNQTEMAKRRFRDIAAIAGLTFQGYPNQLQKARHLQASAGLFFEVLSKYEKNNCLIRQAYDEVFNQQLDSERLFAVIKNLQNKEFVFKITTTITPFAFPILIDRLREQLSSEKLEDRIAKMTAYIQS
jgi:ATP-dependent Lhr-like helicase